MLSSRFSTSPLDTHSATLDVLRHVHILQFTHGESQCLESQFLGITLMPTRNGFPMSHKVFERCLKGVIEQAILRLPTHSSHKYFWGEKIIITCHHYCFAFQHDRASKKAQKSSADFGHPGPYGKVFFTQV